MKKVSLFFKICVRIKYKILLPYNCYLFGHEEYYQSTPRMNFCRRCLKRLS